MKEPKTRCQQIERSIIKNYRKEIWRPFVDALNEYKMIEEGDNIAVCISGGKDSMLLAKCMQEILRHGKMKFGLHFLVMDPGYHPANRQLIEENAALMEIPIEIFDSDIFDVVVDVEARTVMKAGRPVELTNKEFLLLVLFLRNRNVALFRETLYEKVWEGEYSGDSRTLDLHVQRLRKKLNWENGEFPRLVAVYKVGYRLEVGR